MIISRFGEHCVAHINIFVLSNNKHYQNECFHIQYNVIGYRPTKTSIMQMGHLKWAKIIAAIRVYTNQSSQTYKYFDRLYFPQFILISSRRLSYMLLKILKSDEIPIVRVELQPNCLLIPAIDASQLTPKSLDIVFSQGLGPLDRPSEDLQGNPVLLF